MAIIVTVKRENTHRFEILKAMRNWIEEADNETLVRVFNSEFEGRLTYDDETELFNINSESAEKLGLDTNF